MATQKNKSPDFVPDEYLQSIREKLKAQKARPGRSRSEAAKYLKHQILRLLNGGFSVSEILEMVNEGRVVVSESEIRKMFDEHKGKKTAARPKKTNEGVPKGEPSPTSEVDDEKTRSDLNVRDGDEHGDGDDEVLRG